MKLKTLLDPWCEVTVLWAETYEARQKKLHDDRLTVAQYQSTYDCLRHSRAIDLVMLIYGLS